MLNIQPREKQIVALNMLRSAWKQNNSFMLYAPVGFGKTAIAALITDGFVSREMRVMFVAPYTVLLDQTAARFMEYGLPGEEISYVWRDHPSYNPTALIQIASADTLIRREFPDNIDLLIVDEAHLKRKKLLEVIDNLTRNTATKVIGLSGTPFAKFLGNYYQRLIKPTTMKELIAIGALSKYEFYAPSHPDLSKVETSYVAGYGSDYKENQLSQVMSEAKLVGDIVKNWLENGEDRPTICFCVDVAHANFVTVEFASAGVTVEVMTASTPHDERQLTIRRFEQGITKIIINVGVLVAGFDSDVRCIIFARPTKSEMRWIQILGRGLRAALVKITASSSTTQARLISWAIPTILNTTISLHRLMAWKTRRRELLRPMKRKSCRKNAASATTSNQPGFTSARNVVLNRSPGKTWKQINPVG